MHDFEKIRDLIKTENELINQRLTWLGTFQGLLIAALAFTWNEESAVAVVWVFCILGAMVSLSTSLAVYRANKAIKNYEDEWDSIKGKDYSGPDIEGVRSSDGCFWWLMPGYILPWLFLLGWLSIAVIHNCK